MVLELDGRLVSRDHRARLEQKVVNFKSRTQKSPGLGVILVGEDPASQVYVRNKLKSGAELGFITKKKVLSSSSSQEDVVNALRDFNEDPDLHGFLLQLPLPVGLDAHGALNHMTPLKDADALTAENAGLFWLGRSRVTPCTPTGVLSILNHYGLNVAGKEAVVIGRSEIVGKPMAQLLMEANATVTVCHSKTKDLRFHTARADLVVVAAGVPEFLGREDFKKGAWVVDVGIHRKPDGSLVGDCRFDELRGWVDAATPVPGGVGPMTITTLMENTLKLAELQEGGLHG